VKRCGVDTGPPMQQSSQLASHPALVESDPPNADEPNANPR
jgi:hypothetical protein